MKKLLALLMAAMLVFTACGDKEPDYSRYFGKDFYKSFVFDESRIVSWKEYSVDTRDDIYFVGEYDAEGKLLRETCYLKEDNSVIDIDEYMYADYGHYIKNYSQNDTALKNASFSFTDKDNLYFETYFFSYTDPTEDYKLLSHIKTVKSADGRKVNTYYYDKADREYLHTVHEISADGKKIKLTSYRDGVIEEVVETDYAPPYETKTTVYKEGKADYIKTIEQGGVTLTYTDPDGNPIDKP